MGGKNSRTSSTVQLEVNNFGKNEIVDFKMNIYAITEENEKMKSILNELLDSKNTKNIKYSRDKAITYDKFEGFEFTYLEKGEKDEEEKIEDLLEIGLKEKKDNKVFIIYLSKYKKEDILKYLILFIKKEYEEGDQPFILFLTDDNKIDEKEKQDEIRKMVKEAAQNFIKEKYVNDNNEQKKRSNDLNPDDYYLHYNIFLIKFDKEIKKQDNKKINKKGMINLYNKLIKFACSYNEIGDDFFFDEYNIDDNIVNDDNKKNQNNNIFNINNENNINSDNNIDQIFNNSNNDSLINTDSNKIENENFQNIENNKKDDDNKINDNEDNNENNVQNEKEKSYNFFINIICVGRTGTGKSTFINTFCDERKCNIGGGGLSKTQRINIYADYYNHIRIYDTTGFEDEESTENIIKLLQSLEVELVNCKQKIHLVLYFLTGKTNFHKNEFKVFNQIVKYNAHIIFIKTSCENDSKEKYEEEKKKLYDNISKIFKKIEKDLKSKKTPQKEINDLRDLYAKIKLSQTENLILVNLRRNKDNWSQKIFGMPNIYKAIYNYFKPHIIHIEDISKIEDLFDKEDENNHNNNEIILHPIYTIIKNSIFLQSFKTINDIMSYINLEKKWIITRYAFYSFLSGINPIPLVDVGTYYLVEKKLKIELAKLYHFDLKKNSFLVDNYKDKEIKKMNDIANKDKKVEVRTQGFSNIGKGAVEGFGIGIKMCNNFKNFGEAFVNGLKSSILFTSIGCLIGGALNIGIITYVGSKFSEYFEKNLSQDRGVQFLTNAAEDFNGAISYFEKKSNIKEN